MEFDTTAEVVMEKMTKEDGSKPRTRRNPPQKKARKRESGGIDGGGSAEGQSGSENTGQSSLAGAPVARAKRTRSLAKKARAIVKTTPAAPREAPEKLQPSGETPDMTHESPARVARMVSANVSSTVRETAEETGNTISTIQKRR